MSAALTYRPAYLGLFAAQVLALVCNAFLDIQYGGFATEVMIWTVAFALSLRVGWRQHGEATEAGKRWMQRTFWIGLLITLLIFMRMWGLPRAGVYFLAVLMVSYNCVTTTRRHLHLGMLISLVMVLYASTHYRADWAMLFYLVPYVAAVVFTLVAEQINRKASELRELSVGHQIVGAQGMAISAATIVILMLSWLLYVLTPQISWLPMEWRWGQPSGISLGEGSAQTDSGELQPGRGEGGVGGKGGAASAGQGGGRIKSGWPSPDEMRGMASRQGMPAWQRDVINSMADLTEKVESVMKPVIQRMEQLWDALKKWLKENRDKVARTLSLLGILVLLYALFRLLREARVATWLRTRFDYVRLVLLDMHGADTHGAQTYYEAMVRLFMLHNIERDSRVNTLEYLSEIKSYYRHLRQETEEMTRHYEDARYGGLAGSAQVERMRNLYRQIFKSIS